MQYLFPEDRIGNVAIGSRTMWRFWATATITTMTRGHQIYFVVPLPMPHNKPTDNVKNRSPPLRIRLDRRPFAKTKFSRLPCQD